MAGRGRSSQTRGRDHSRMWCGLGAARESKGSLGLCCAAHAKECHSNGQDGRAVKRTERQRRAGAGQSNFEQRARVVVFFTRFCRDGAKLKP